MGADKVHSSGLPCGRGDGFDGGDRRADFQALSLDRCGPDQGRRTSGHAQSRRGYYPGLVPHELATNAIKYGALKTPEGQVSFNWEIFDGDQHELSIRWLEMAARPSRTLSVPAMVREYVRAALTSLFGRKPMLAFNVDGLLCEARGLLSRWGQPMTMGHIDPPHDRPRRPPHASPAHLLPGRQSAHRLPCRADD